MMGGSTGGGRARGRDILSARRGGVIIINNDGHIIAFIENRVPDTAGQPVMPEPPSPITAIVRLRSRPLRRLSPLKAAAEAGARP